MPRHHGKMDAIRLQRQPHKGPRTLGRRSRSACEEILRSGDGSNFLCLGKSATRGDQRQPVVDPGEFDQSRQLIGTLASSASPSRTLI